MQPLALSQQQMTPQQNLAPILPPLPASAGVDTLAKTGGDVQPALKGLPIVAQVALECSALGT